MSTSAKPVVVVGSVTMDMVTRTPQIPKIGQSIIGTGFETTPGGKGANQAVAAARLGYPVSMVGNVGRDVFGPVLVDNLNRAGVSTEAIEKVAGPSGLAPIFLSDDRREQHRRGSGSQRQGGVRHHRSPRRAHPLRRHGLAAA